MEIGYVDSFTNYPTTGKPTEAPKDRLGQMDFMKLLTAELMHQDPFKPMGNAEMMNQLMTMQQMQSSMDLTNSIKDLLHESRVSSAAALLGQTVRGADADSGEVVGIVTGIAITGNDVELILNGNGSSRLSLSDVTDIKMTMVE